MPVYNERATVEAGDRGRALGGSPGRVGQLVIVDDGSRTARASSSRPATWPDTVTVVYHERNRGKGAAMRTALAHATGDLSAILDADLEYDAADLAPAPRAAARRRGEVVFGTRAWSTPLAFSFWYVLGNKAVTLATNVIYNCCISDVMTCHKAMRTSSSARCRSASAGSRSSPRSLPACSAGERIYEVPISYRARSREEGKS